MTLKVPPKFMTTILLQRKSHQDSDRLANTEIPKCDSGPFCFLSGSIETTIPLLSIKLVIQVHRIKSMIITGKDPINYSNMYNTL